MPFTPLDLQPPILQAVGKMGDDPMTPIPEPAILVIVEGPAVLGLTETGFGKTKACGIPLVRRAQPELNAISALVLAPSRERALEYVQNVEWRVKETEVAPFAIFGGVKMSVGPIKLRHKAPIPVATPGRWLDFIRHAALNLSQVRTLVLDEADEILKMDVMRMWGLIMSGLVHETRRCGFWPRCPGRLTAWRGPV